MELRIATNDDGDIEVWEGNTTTGPLCMGEVIEQVIGKMFADNKKVYPMYTPLEWAERRLKRSPSL